MTVFTNRCLTALAATAVLALGLYGCGGGGGGGPTTGAETMMPDNVDLSNVTPGFMAEAGPVTIEAGQSKDHGDISFTCAAGGRDCEVMVMVDTNGAISATSTGGTVTAMTADDYQNAVTPMNVDLAGVAAGFMAEAGTVTIEAGQSEEYGDVAFTCAAGGRDCAVMVMLGANGAISATSTGGTVTAMNSNDYQNAVTPMNVDMAGVAAGFMAEAGNVTIEAGQSEEYGDIAFSCAAGGRDCEVMVMVDANGAISATSTGSTVTAMNSNDYQNAVTPMNVDMAGVAAGFMAEAGNVTIEAGQSEEYGDIAFSCAAGGRDCEVMVMVDANGAITAASTGGTVTTMNADAYNTRIPVTNEANSIHAVAEVDALNTGYSVVYPGSGSGYHGPVASAPPAEGFGPRWSLAIPWVNRAGAVNFEARVGGSLSASELDPVSSLERSLNTADISDYTEDTSHGLGSDWKAFEARKEYAGAGALTVSVATDVHNADTTERPWVGYGDYDRKIEVSDEIPALAADWDLQGLNVVGGVKGSIDGVEGEFTCDTGVSACYLETSRDADAEGYYPYENVVFTRDDNGTSEVLPAVTNSQSVPTVDYLVFGIWQYVPEDITAVDDYNFGVFAGGGDPFYGFDLEAELYGTATYNGSAHGRYYEGRSSEAPSVGSFDARVTLEADFGIMGDTSDLGRLSGTVNNIRYGGAASGFPAQLTLQEADIGTFHLGSYTDRISREVSEATAMIAVGVVSHGQLTPSWSGAWLATFFGNGKSFTDQPTGVAGTFGITNDEDGLVGSFGARR